MDLKIFTDDVDYTSMDQIYDIAKSKVFLGSKIRIMPDVHAGRGCVVGFTATMGTEVIPNIVGCDIGCGMLTVELDVSCINYGELDRVIRSVVPSGRSVHERVNAPTYVLLDKLKCRERLKNVDTLKRSCGTLGGGNHFIEIDEDDQGNKYLIVHSGSRNLGKQVADIYQNYAIELMKGKDELRAAEKNLIAEYKNCGRDKEIEVAIARLRVEFEQSVIKVPRELSYLTGKLYEDYLHDMKVCIDFAIKNRNMIANNILAGITSLKCRDSFHTIHNYIDLDRNIVRKGAISANAGERVLIPLNMRDGCILGTGKGNPDWNYSAPHGAGRVMSRSQARSEVSIDEYVESMKGIYTTSVGRSTVDESPMAYKKKESILGNINETVCVDKVIKPAYNYKAS